MDSRISAQPVAEEGAKESPVGKLPTIALDSPDRFINRELSWLAFNQRVLDEAMNNAHPLLERVRFLSISASNLDEFYMVRVAGLKGQVLEGISRPSQEMLTPAQQLDAISEAVAKLVNNQHDVWNILREDLDTAGVHVLSSDELSSEERAWLHQYFVEEIFPVLTPIAVDPALPFATPPMVTLAPAAVVLDTPLTRTTPSLRIVSLPLPPWRPAGRVLATVVASLRPAPANVTLRLFAVASARRGPSFRFCS